MAHQASVRSTPDHIASEKHQLLSESDTSSVEYERTVFRPSIWSVIRQRWLLVLCFALTFVGSMVLNIVFFFAPKTEAGELASKWAKLVYNVPTPIYSSTEYGPAIGTEEERDRRWNALDISEGIIAMSDDEAISYGLPLSERFPWDQSKGVYLLGAHHDIHCLKRIYTYVSDNHHGRVPALSYGHIVHCLDTLLQDVYCHADDTPWMQLPPQPFRQKYPEYQTRQCKSWDKMMTWARNYNACYKNENVTDRNGVLSDDPFEHFRHCPEGSPYLPLMKQFFDQKDAGLNPPELYELYKQDKEP